MIDSWFNQLNNRLLTARFVTALFAIGLFAVGAASVVVPTTAQAAAGINQTVNYQGRLLSATGAVVPDGTYNMEFKIWQDGNGCLPAGTCTSANAGTNNAGTLKWTEDWVYGTGSPDNRVTVKNGYFSVNLGSLTSLAAVNFNQDTLWLTTNIGNTSTAATFAGASGDGYMIPFKRLAANPYAINSGQLGGLTSSQYVQLGQGIQAASSTNALIGLNQTSTGNILDLQKGGADVQLINNSGQTLFRPTTDSVTALQVQKAGTTTVVFTVDSSNSRIGIGTGAPAYAVDAVGSVNASTSLKVAGTDVCTTSGCTVSSTSGILNQNASAQTSSNFWISGVGKAATFNATTDIETAGTTRIDASGNLVNIASLTNSGTITSTGTVSSGGYELADSGTNLLVNGDFETNSTNGWSGVTAVTSGGYSGNYAAQVTGPSIVNSDNYIPVNTSDAYQLEGYFKKSVNGTTPGTLYFGYYAYDASKTLITTSPCGSYCYFAAAAYTFPDNNWHKFDATTTGVGTVYPDFPVGTAYVRVMALVNYTGSANTVTLLDHMSLTRVNNGPLFVGNNFNTTNLTDQSQLTQLYTTSTNNFIIQPAAGGNVGIGTSTPTSLLTVGANLTNSITPVATFNTLGAKPILVGDSSTNLGIMLGYGGNDIQGRTGSNFSTNGNLYLNNYGGAVGIGTNTPTAAAKLDVTGGRLYVHAAAETYSLGLGRTDFTGHTYIGVSGTSATPDTVFSNNAGTELARLQNAGNFGIGTASPAAKLQVAGSTYLGGDLGITGQSGVQSQANNFNVAPNSSFEVKANSTNTDPDGWLSTSVAGNGSATTVRATDAQTDGAASIKSVLTGTTSYSFIQSTAYVPVTSSTTYVHSVDIKNDATANTCGNGIYVRAEWFTAAQVFISDGDTYSNALTTTSWQTYTGSVTSPSTAAFAKLQYYSFQINPNANGCTRWFDNVVFRPAGFSGPITATGNIQGASVDGTTGINTGAAGGTQRIDASGNLVNIGTITSGLINGQTISSAANFTGTVTSSGNITSTAGVLNVQGNGASTISNTAITNDTSAIMLQLSGGADVTLGPLQFQFGTHPSATGTNRYSYIGTGDSSAMRTLALNTNGSGAFGSVGIGTVSPGQLLDVQGDAEFGANNWLDIVDTGGGNGRLKISATGSVDFGTAFLFRNNAGSTEYARINGTTGNLSVGNTNNTYKLDVTGDINTSANLRTGGTIRLDASGNLSNIGTIASGLINGQTINSTANFTGTVAVATSLSTPTITTASGDLTIDPTGNTVVKGSTSVTGTAALDIQNSSGSILYARNDGNIGIGSTTPGTTLEVTRPNQTLPGNVSGDGKVTLAVLTNDAQAADVGGTIGFGGNYNGSSTPILFGAIAGRKANSTAGSADGYLGFSVWNGASGLLERMRLDTNGNLTVANTIQGTQLISTVATGTAPLTVASTTKVTNLNADLLDGIDSTGFAAATGGAGYIQNQTASPQAAGFNINGNGTLGGTLAVTGAITGSSTIQGTSVDGTTGINTGAAGGTQRIDATGNLVNIGSINMTGSVATNGSNIVSYSNVYTLGSTAPTTGTLEIILPNGFTNTMLSFHITGYDYSAAGAWSATLSGYNYAGSSAWINTSAAISSGAPFTSARLAYDSSLSKTVLLLGTTSTVWNYPQFTVDQVVAGYSTQTIWGSGYSSAYLASEASITAIASTPVAITASTANTVNLQGSTPGTAQTGNFNITGTGIAGTLQASTVTGSNINTGAGAGTQRIDASGNLVNIGTITSGLINGQTISSAANFTGTVAIASNTGILGSLSVGTASASDRLHIAQNGGVGFRLEDLTPATGGLARLTQIGQTFSINTYSNGGTFTGTPLTVVGSTQNVAIGSTLSAAGAITGSSTIQGTQFIATTTTGFAPLVVSSTTKVTNLNADLLDGIDSTGFAAATGGTGYIQAQASTPGSAQNTNFNLGTGVGIGATFNATTGINTGATGGTLRLNSAGALTNITGYTQTSGSATFTQGATDILTVTTGAVVPTTDMVIINSSGAATATAGVNNLNLKFVGSTTTAVENGSLRVDLTPGTFAGSTTNGLRVALTAGAASGTTNGIKLDLLASGGAGVYNGLYLPGITTPGAGQESAINIGTGWDDILRYNNATLISGTGIIQNAALSSGVNYSNITQVGSITSGIWGGTTIAANKGGTGVTTTPTNGQLLFGNGTNYTVGTLGVTGLTATPGAGSLALAVNYGAGANNAAAGANTFTCNSGTGNLSGGGGTVTLGTSGTNCGAISISSTPSFTTITSTQATGTAPLTVASTTKVTSLNADLLDGIDSTGFAVATGGAGYIQNQTASPQAAGFNINGNGTIGGALTATGAINLGSVGASTASSTLDLGDTNNATGTQTVSIGSSANAANALTLEAGNTGKIQIGNAATAHTIQIGTAAAIQGITIGSATTTSSTTIEGGATAGTAIAIGNGNTAHVIKIGAGGTSTIQGITVGSNFTGSTTTLQGAGVAETLASNSAIIQTTTNSTNAFQVQNSSGTPIFQVDTSTTSNLITNPGFEVNVTTGWTGTSATLTRNTTTGQFYHGQASATVAVSVANGGATVNGFTASITPATYNFSFYARNSTAGALSITITGGSAPTCTLNSTVMVTTGFQRYNCSFTSTTSNVTAILIKSFTTGTFYIDGVQLTSGAGLQPYAAQGAIQLRGTINSPVTFQSSSNSTTAFQIQDAAGTANLFVADTLNGRINIGGLGIGAGQLYVSGSVPTSSYGSAATGTAPAGVVVQGHYAYVVNTTSGTLQIFTTTGGFPVSTGSVATGSSPISVAVSGRYAYVVNKVGNTLQIFDVSNPTAPASVGSVATGSTPWKVVVSGRYAYVVNSGADQLEIFDVANPASPVRVGVVSAGTDPEDVVVVGRYAYVVNFTSNTLQIFNVSDPTAPASVGSVTTGASTGPIAVAVNGPIAYVALQTTHFIASFDVTNPAAPSLNPNQPGNNATTGTNPSSVAIAGRNAYVTSASNDLEVFDISSGVNRIGSVTTGSAPSDVAIAGRYAYVTTNTGNHIESYDLGGEYAQQLEVGGAEIGQLNVDGDSSLAGDASIAGGLTVSRSLSVMSNFSAAGVLSVTAAGAVLTGPTQTVITAPSLTLDNASGSSANSVYLNVAGTNYGIIRWGTGGDVFIGSTQSAGQTHLNSDSGRTSGTGVFVGGDTSRQNLVVFGTAYTSGSGSSCTYGSTTGGASCSSDGRLKMNIQNLGGGLGDVMALRPVTYNWKANPSGPAQVGFIAQEVQSIFPSSVVTGDNGYLQLDYASLVTPAIGAIQEEQDEINSLNQRVSSLGTSMSTGSLSVSDDLNVAGTATTTALNVTGLAQLGDLAVQGNASVAGHLVAAAVAAGDLNITGTASLSTLNVTGQATIQTLAVTGDATFEGDITLAGHIKTTGQPPTAALLDAAGSSNATVQVDGNDVTGVITVTVGDPAAASHGSVPAVTGPLAGDLVALTFAKAYDKAPKVLITANDALSALMGVYPDDASARTVSVGVASIPVPRKTYKFTYYVVQ